MWKRNKKDGNFFFTQHLRLKFTNHLFNVLLDDSIQEGKENKQSYKDLLEGSVTEPARVDGNTPERKTTKKARPKKTRTLTR